jgi:starch synthase
MHSDPYAVPSGEGLPRPDYQETVVHIASEYWPYARTGGLAEAVRGIARYEAAAGSRMAVMMPLYGTTRTGFPELVPVGDPFPVPVADRVETARVYRNPSAPPNPEMLFVEHTGYFDRDGIYGEGDDAYWDNHLRFAFFSRAVLEWLPKITEGPVILHAHDWHTALAPVYLRTLLRGDPFYDRVAAVLTVHNAGYQGHLGPEAMGHLGLPPHLFHPDYMEWYGKTNLLKGGLVFSDMVTTVSPTHAHELRTRTGGFGLHDTFNGLQDRFVGVLNGIDYDVWDPVRDPWIACNFGPEDITGKARCKTWLQERTGLPVREDVPLFGMTARLVEQKGFDILLESTMVSELDAQWIFLGEGQRRYREGLAALQVAWPEKVATFFQFSEEREHKLLAAADFLLMPSLYEPCGLTQMRAQRYGALPVVRRVGGLGDTVEDRVNGFVFDEYAPWALTEAVRWAVELYAHRPAWEEHVWEAMARDFSWGASVTRYQDVYRRAVARRDGRDGDAA